MKLVKKCINIFVPHKGNDHKPHLLREEGIAALLLVILLVTAFSFSGKVAVQTKLLTASVQSLLLADLANENRIDNDLPKLVWNDTLARAAQLKADDMAEKGYFAHTSPEGATPWSWFTQAGYLFAYAGENLAVNYSESVDVDEAWMDSPTHRANILNGNFTEIGIATAVGEYKGKETTFVVQMFASPFIPRVVATGDTATTPVATSVESLETSSIPEVLGEETTVEEVVETLFVSDTYIAVENTAQTNETTGPAVTETPLAAATETGDYVAAPLHVIDSSAHYSVFIYRILFAVVAISLLLMIGIEYKKQHYKNIAYAAGVLLVLALLILLQTVLHVQVVSVI
jgi:uncharacterized protein YkwD